MKYSKVSIFGVLLLILVFSFCSSELKDVKLNEIHGTTMGTTYMIKWVSGEIPVKKEDIHSGIENILKLVNRQMSVFDPESEISQFNRSLDGVWFKVSGPLASVVNDALVVSRLSDGAFDVTAGPLIDLWGFGPRRKGDGIPPEDEIAETMTCTGYQGLDVSLNPPQLRKRLTCVDRKSVV